MGDLRVNSEALIAAASAVDESAAGLRQEFDNICAAFAEVVGGNWTGQAADGLRGDWTRWCEGFEDVMAGLHREANALAAAAARYSTTDDAGASALASQMGM